MAVGRFVSVAEYLRTNYRPDCDYVDGEIQERNLGERSHGRIQGLIMAWLFQREAQWGVKAAPEVRLQISSSRFRIPDLTVLSSGAPRQEIVTTPPLLCIEILSRGDTLASIWDRIQDYFSIGVPVCWLLDLLGRRCWTAMPGVLAEVPQGILRAGDIEMPLAAVLE